MSTRELGSIPSMENSPDPTGYRQMYATRVPTRIQRNVQGRETSRIPTPGRWAYLIDNLQALLLRIYRYVQAEKCPGELKDTIYVMEKFLRHFHVIMDGYRYSGHHPVMSVEDVKDVPGHIRTSSGGHREYPPPRGVSPRRNVPIENDVDEVDNVPSVVRNRTHHKHHRSISRQPPHEYVEPKYTPDYEAERTGRSGSPRGERMYERIFTDPKKSLDVQKEIEKFNRTLQDLNGEEVDDSERPQQLRMRRDKSPVQSRKQAMDNIAEHSDKLFQYLGDGGHEDSGIKYPEFSEEGEDAFNEDTYAEVPRPHADADRRKMGMRAMK